MKKFFVLFLCAAMAALSACAGRDAMPVSSYKYGDEKLSCADLRMEASKSEREVLKLYSEKNSASSGNIAIGAVGALLFWPALFALDTSDAEKIEIEAHKERIETLQRLMRDKNCGAYKSKIEKFEETERAKKKSEPSPANDRIER